MPASTAQTSSKSSKKKTAAAQYTERADSPALSTSSGAAKTGEDDYESPYIKELQKNIRNLNKKIANASKTDALLAENKGKSLDKLVEEKIINTDQKAQIQKKPAMQAQLAQSEEQLHQYQKVHEQYRSKAVQDKTDWHKTAEQSKNDAIGEAKAGFRKTLNENLLVLSQFLRLAATRREEGQDPESDESQAIEGVLMAIYSGDQNAVDAMLKLVDGSPDGVISVPGETLLTNYANVKSLAQTQSGPSGVESEPVEVEGSQEIGTDLTLAHASATEIDAGEAQALGSSSEVVATNGLSNADALAGTGNEVAESHWDANDNSVSQDWVDVKVPRDPSETETGLEATPAAPAVKSSWADDHPEPAPENAAAAAAAPGDDGFHQVQRNKGRNEREGGGNSGWRGGRGRGGFRGRGHGQGHGSDGLRRGRGGNRNPGLPVRPRHTEES